MKKVLVICLIALFMTPLKANAFSWGDFFRALFGISTTSVETLKENITTTLSDMKKESAVLDTNTQTKFLAVAKELSSDNNYKTVSENLKTANSKTEAVNKVYSDYTTYLKNNKLEIVVIIKTMPEANKTSFINNINSLSEYAQKYSELSSNGKTATSKATQKTYEDNELNTSISDANALAEELSEKSKTLSTFLIQAKLLGTLGGLKF